jgi:RNA polymerase sigma factor (sigma-70 family)
MTGCIPDQPGFDQGAGALLPPEPHNARTRSVRSQVSLPPFQTLLDAYGHDVHRFLSAIVGRVDADDCYQETWLAALRAYPSLRSADNLRGWVLTIAHSKAIDRVRARRRDPIPLEELPELPAASGPERSAPPRAAGSGRAAGFRRADDDVWARLRRLPAKQRTAVTLRFLTDASYPQISGLMGISQEAARRNVHEGLKRLRTEYER